MDFFKKCIDNIFSCKTKILEHINHVTEKFKSKYPEDNELKSYVEEKKIQFIDMKDGIGTIANKIELDAQNRSPDGEELAGFYTDMFLYVLKAKVLTFLDVCTFTFYKLKFHIINFKYYLQFKIRLSQLNLHELAPVREENLDPKQEFMEEIHGRKGSLSVSEYGKFLKIFRQLLKLVMFFRNLHLNVSNISASNQCL